MADAHLWAGYQRTSYSLRFSSSRKGGQVSQPVHLCILKIRSVAIQIRFSFVYTHQLMARWARRAATCRDDASFSSSSSSSCRPHGSNYWWRAGCLAARPRWRHWKISMERAIWRAQSPEPTPSTLAESSAGPAETTNSGEPFRWATEILCPHTNLLPLFLALTEIFFLFPLLVVTMTRTLYADALLRLNRTASSRGRHWTGAASGGGFCVCCVVCCRPRSFTGRNCDWE